MSPKAGGPQATRSAFADATDEKVSWVRAAAQSRPVFPELHLFAYWTQVTTRPERAAADRTTSTASTSPRRSCSPRRIT